MVRLGRVSLQSRKSRTADPNLTGWAGIEDHMITHDDASMSDYADDIDTMLVFAALFSAVVTTFVAQTYTSFQGDSVNTTNQLIAYQISAGNNLHIPPTINSTIASLLAPQTATVTTSVLWINALFFLSLVLSLAAALLGIMAKQWIREYLKWDSALAVPRENVMLRQIRFEAWEEWRVEAIIWSIPVFLEISMVLFLTGIAVLLWNLDDVLAKIITTVVALFLGVVAALTVLPVFIKRCPYTSPTTWILLRLYILSRDAVISLCARSDARWLKKLLDEFAIVATWRDWDLDSCRVTGWNGRLWPWSSRSTQISVMAELDHELAMRPLIPNVSFDNSVRTLRNRTILSDVLKDIRDTCILIRALLWVEQASQDERIEQYISQSMQSIHSIEDAFNPQCWDIQARIITDWCILAAFQHNDLATQTHSFLMPSINDSSGVGPINSMSDVRRRVGVHSIAMAPGRRKLLLRADLGPSHRSFFTGFFTKQRPSAHAYAFEYIVRLLAVDLRFITTRGRYDHKQPSLAFLRIDRWTSGKSAWLRRRAVSTRRP